MGKLISTILRRDTKVDEAAIEIGSTITQTNGAGITSRASQNWRTASPAFHLFLLLIENSVNYTMQSSTSKLEFASFFRVPLLQFRIPLSL